MSTTATVFAGDVIATLQAHEAELRRAGIRHLSLFGSVARGDAGADSETITTAIIPNYPLTVTTRPTAIQHKASRPARRRGGASNKADPQAIGSSIR